jgi:transcriptional regulator with XRE-family HTH domain
LEEIILTNLKRIRIEAGLTQASLAEKAGLKLTAIRDYEQNHKPINNAAAISVYKIAVALGCKVEDLLERENL